MRIVSKLTAVSLLLWGTVCVGEIRPVPGITDPRVREVVYDKDDVIRLIGYVGYQTHLRLSPDEQFIGVGAGDTGGLDITADGNDTWIKPKAELVRTNIDVKTNLRVYHFDYEVRKDPPKNRNSMIYSIAFRYPDEEAKQRADRATRNNLRDKLHAAADKINRDYWYCGNPSMKPIEAYDDGIQTHIKFSAHAEYPAIFAENADESESLINFHVDPDNEEVVVHRIAHRFILRRGELVGCIENRQFTGGGKRLTSGTVKDEVILKTQPTENEAAGHE
ncbi:TrbG/VirB9 family P-type conjugative transfer protein [Methylomonas rosea]|uniref:TrbG/VirB9 family P-type conjugative transfer protein n=1 Tax=Methylomonas rosea TaxID=2952227 RepID=A0ABT1TUP9_9GAMM|nr:TrbG/VirB9 family P-type conjugative transfer protein [Methylomonas sp. WSC-7]MCQ8118491.1 TrbG/VirB9 family P-type conjugative transfer protein [Methylomonas sp. WSC-7]PPD24643.1 MAG: conjugal transfer protein TrbG [Methylobacter sp.]